MSRIAQAFQRTKQKNRAAFVAYGTVVCLGAIDIAPETLYARSRP